jgi:hypothetical protein
MRHFGWVNKNIQLLSGCLMLIFVSCGLFENPKNDSAQYPDSATIELSYPNEQPFDLMAFIAAADIFEKNLIDSLPNMQRISKEIDDSTFDATERITYLNDHGIIKCKELRLISELGRYEKIVIYFPETENKLALYRVYVYDKSVYDPGYSESLEQEVRFYIRNGKAIAVRQSDGNIQSKDLPEIDIMALISEVEDEPEL